MTTEPTTEPSSSEPGSPAPASAGAPTGSLSEAGIEAMRAVMARPGDTVLALDFDGTLAPIVGDPEQAHAQPDAVDALARLGRHLGTVAVITGRPARTAVRLGGFAGRPGLESMVVLGQYGVERWDAAGDSYDIPPEPAGIAALTDELPGLLAELGLADARIENKGRAVGVHTRGMPEARAAFDRLLAPLRDLAERHELHLEPGKQVLEIRPAGMDKGVALRDLMAETGRQQVIFAGDDLGDLSAFETVEQLRTEGIAGLLICSASAEEDALSERADLSVDGPDGMADWLSRLADALESGAH